MFDLKENYKISGELATGGMVLLKNEGNILPFDANRKIGIVGKSCLDLIKGGGGSAEVRTEYTRSIKDGLMNKHNENKFCFYEKSIELAENDDYSVESLNELAKQIDTAIVVYKRYGSEGDDRFLSKELKFDIENCIYNGEQNDGTNYDLFEEKVGYYYPSESEIELFSNLEKSDIKNVVLILNISSTVDLSFIDDYPKIKSVLLTYLSGMEIGTAIADILSGDVAPSGRLVDTIAYRYEDYPTADCFDYNKNYTEYREGIYVGYRYFETFAKEKVMYPFGYGLSYTDFEFSDYSVSVKDDIITATVTVKNIGNVSAREVVQIYVKAPMGDLPKPSIELKGFAKTKEILPNETETVEVSFKISDMASFDEIGLLGAKSAYMLEKGEYEIYVGKNVRDILKIGSYIQAETKVTEQLTARFSGEKYERDLSCLSKDVGVDKGYTLYDVSEGKISLESFLGQLSVDELISLATCQPPSFAQGTGGIGNIRSKGVPNPQTADGPAGIRRSVYTTCFPCGTLIACSWDTDLQYEMGKAMGYEGYSTGVDILLGPSMNIHRNVLCGRNFEYLSEDPLITGKTAAAIINGVQSEGLCATVKHFAVNNCEYYRQHNNSIVSERALREIYLKGFEIAVKESNPAFIMSAYNKVNGKYASANEQLMSGVLRDEWHYEGAVMTDWRNKANLDDEIIAGNNIKMPFGYPDQIKIAKSAFENGKITLAQLQHNAYYVLKAVMKTRSFKQRDFGKSHTLSAEKLIIPAIDVNGISSTRILQSTRDDGKDYIYQLSKDQRAQRTFVYYIVNAENEGDYNIAVEFSTNCPQFEIWFMNEKNEKTAVAKCDMATNENEWYCTTAKIHLSKGENVLKLMFADEPDIDYDFYNGWFDTPKTDIRIAELVISK